MEIRNRQREEIIGGSFYFLERNKLMKEDRKEG